VAVPELEARWYVGESHGLCCQQNSGYLLRIVGGVLVLGGVAACCVRGSLAYVIGSILLVCGALIVLKSGCPGRFRCYQLSEAWIVDSQLLSKIASVVLSVVGLVLWCYTLACMDIGAPFAWVLTICGCIMMFPGIALMVGHIEQLPSRSGIGAAENLDQLQSSPCSSGTSVGPLPWQFALADSRLRHDEVAHSRVRAQCLLNFSGTLLILTGLVPFFLVAKSMTGIVWGVSSCVLGAFVIIWVNRIQIMERWRSRSTRTIEMCKSVKTHPTDEKDIEAEFQSVS